MIRKSVSGVLNYYELNGLLSDSIKYLQEKIAEIEKEYPGYDIRMEEHDEYAGYSFTASRAETDEEYEARCKKLKERLKKAQIDREKRDRQEYERLVKKYEGKAKGNELNTNAMDQAIKERGGK